MGVASAGCERRIYESTSPDFPVFVRVPSPPAQWCVYDQETDLSGLLKLWTGIRLFMGADALHTVERWRRSPCAASAEPYQARQYQARPCQVRQYQARPYQARERQAKWR